MFFVLGLSSSEVWRPYRSEFQSGSRIGGLSKTILDILKSMGIFLAVQGCEHLNHPSVVEEPWRTRRIWGWSMFWAFLFMLEAVVS